MTEQNTNRTCESCGARFDCGAERGDCWCFELSVPTESRLEIGRLYKDCLCPVCLLKYSDKESSEGTK